MKVAVFCECSQEVTKAFRAKGHEAYSYDLQDCYGGHPEWHFKTDVRELLTEHFDLGIFHPTCKYITNSGVRWLYTETGRREKLKQACEFFNLRHRFNCDKMATENPIPHKYAVKDIGIYNQLIQPYQFGHTTSKATCLWLKNLPLLTPTKIVSKNERTYEIHRMPPGPERERMRSHTFSGIAAAMAAQWG